MIIWEIQTATIRCKTLCSEGNLNHHLFTFVRGHANSTLHHRRVDKVLRAFLFKAFRSNSFNILKHIRLTNQWINNINPLIHWKKRKKCHMCVLWGGGRSPAQKSNKKVSRIIWIFLYEHLWEQFNYSKECSNTHLWKQSCM